MDSYADEKPIAALATPLGESALALIRVSGKNAVDLIATRFSAPHRLKDAAGNTVILGWLLDENGACVDQVLVSVYRAPKSYTGEDSADISCHGGYAVMKAALDTLYSAGFRAALPGEFTFRAFMNGKLDLTRAEAVMELVSARTDRARESAVRRLSGALEAEIRALKDRLVRVLAGTELFLDYSEDEFAESAAEERDGVLPLRNEAEEALCGLRALESSFRVETLYQEGALAVLAGKPNAGKSSLFNRLLKEDRAIVSASPGTTRDWIEAAISIEGIPVRLADTAGLRDADSEIEKSGIERSRSLIRDANVVIYLVDGTAGLTEEDERFLTLGGEGKPLLAVWNKADIAPPPKDNAGYSALIGVSAATGEGIAALTTRLAELLTGGGILPTDTSSGAASARQKALISRAASCIAEALDLADKQEALDIIAPRLREAVDCLGEITGEVSTADILEVMFGSFCVGK